MLCCAEQPWHWVEKSSLFTPLTTSQQVFIFSLLWLFFWRGRMGLSKGVNTFFFSPVDWDTFSNLIQNLSLSTVQSDRTWVKCYCLKFYQLFPVVLVHTFARVRHLVRGVPPCFYFCVHHFFRDPSYFQALQVLWAIVCGNAGRKRQKCVLLTAQNSATKYIIACIVQFFFNTFEFQWGLCNFATLQNVTLFRPWEDAWGTLSGLWWCSCWNAIHVDQG